MATRQACSNPEGGLSAGISAAWSRLILAGILLAGLAAAGPAWADDPPQCEDHDNDGFVVCNGCTPPAGKTCGDCNDNDGIAPGQDCAICTGPGCPSSGFCAELSSCPTAKTCLTASKIVCQGSTPVCETPEQPVAMWGQEGGGATEQERRNDPTCFDGKDNDCDGLVDHESDACKTQEFCDGFDNDGNGVIDDGLGLGDTCSVSVDACQASGVKICGPSGDVVCSAVPPTPVAETGALCADGKDNDCNGLVDTADPACQPPAPCGGISGLGDACTAGEGACQVSGQKICGSDGDSLVLVCDAVPLPAGIEGPSGPTCSDGIDNDCDGRVDASDTDCDSASLSVTCALPYLRGRPGADCTAWHEIFYDVSGAGPDAKVTAELLALDADGNVLQAIPVHKGDEAHLASRIGPRDFKVSSSTNKKGTRHTVFAPIPLLRVTVDDGLRRARAYCSNIPFLKVVEPSGGVVSQSAGDVTDVAVAIPLVDPASLSVKVDGVQILESISPSISDLGACTPPSPCSGTVDVHGNAVQVTELAVQSSLSPDVASANVLRMKLTHLGCGGHVVVVGGERYTGSFPIPASAQCHEDDIHDKATSSTFGIDIESPTPGEVTSEVPTPVVGQACHGRPIASVKINGRPVDLSGAVVTPGDGENSATTVTVPFQTTLDQTDLARDLESGDVPLQTFDPGSNRLIAEGTDDLGNRTYKTFTFAVGDVAPPGLPPLSATTLPSSSTSVETPVYASADAPQDLSNSPLVRSFEAELRKELSAAALEHFQTAMAGDPTEIDNAFVVGLAPDAVQDFFSKKCVDAATSFVDGISARMPVGSVIDSEKVSGGCSCDPTVAIRIAGFSVDPSAISCPVTFEDGYIHVAIDLPDVNVSLNAHGSCKDTFLGACVAETIVSGSLSTTISDVKVEFDVTEGQLEGTAAPAPPVRGHCEANPSQACGTNADCGGSPPKCVVGTANTTSHVHTEVNCLASACNWAANIFASVVNGIAGTKIIDPVIVDFTFDADFNTEIGASEPDPIKLDGIKVDEEVVQNYQQKLSGALSHVRITPDGLVAGLKGSFATLVVDPAVERTPGALLTPAPLPTMPVPNVESAFVGLADDAFNQLFASMTAAGRLNLGCNASGKTLGDFLPADCDDIVVEAGDAATAIARGLCYGLRQTDCETLAGDTASLTALEQGTCHGFRGDDCESLAVPGPVLGAEEKATCRATPFRNLNATQPVLLCVRQDVPPVLKIVDDGGTGAVESKLRLNDLSTAILVDREGDGPSGELTSTPSCFAADAPTVGDCNLLALCLDLNFNFAMQSQTCADGKPGIVTQFNSIQILHRQPGLVCIATRSGDDQSMLDGAATDDVVTLDLGNSAQTFSPPLCMKGLTLGDLVTCSSPKLIAIEADGSPAFQDYLALTCDIQP
jgi:hypothetical protein